jgi:hypothetical protein
MNKTRRSLYYPATYLTVAGLSLLLAPQFSLKILLSNDDYGDVFPRVAGLMILGLGLIVIQVGRNNFIPHFGQFVCSSALVGLVSTSIPEIPTSSFYLLSWE